MLRNYLTIALRYLRKNKIFSLINILGLAIGLACCMLIALFVYDELHYDTYAANADRICRVSIRLMGDNGAEVYPDVDVAIGQGIKAAQTRMRAARSACYKYNGVAFANSYYP